MRRLLLFLLLIGLATPGWAGQTARYRYPRADFTLVIEVEGDNARIEFVGQNWYLLTTGGEDYVVYPLPAGARVMRMADVQRIFAERRLTLPADFSDMAGWHYVARGESVVAGYRGAAFHLRTEGGMAEQPSLVISRDPALAPFAGPLARHLDWSFLTFQRNGVSIPPIFLQMRALIGDATPLMFAGITLQGVETGTIGAERFALPAAPIPIEEIRRDVEANMPAR